MGAGCSSDKAAATPEAPASEPKGQADLPASKYVAPATPPAAPSPVPAPASAPVDDEFDDEDDGSAEGKRDPAARMDALTRCFEALDKDKSGTIDFRELKQYLFKTGVNIHHISVKAEELMKRMDLNSDNLISLDEFTQMMEALLTDRSDEDLEVWVAEVVFTATSRNVVGFGNSLGEVLQSLDFSDEQVAKLKQVFKALDRDGSGFVELPELKLMLGRSGWELDTTSDEVQAIMDKLDKNGDAKISEQEFFVTLSAVRKSVNSDPAFMELLENVLTVAQTGGPAAGGKPVLTEVLFAEDA